MKIFRSKNKELNSDSVVTIGTFDGVHVGHQKIVSQLINAGKANNLKSIILTFFPHPRMVLQKDTSIKLINTLDERIAILKKLGLEVLFIKKFTNDFSRLTAQNFVKNILVDTLHAKKVIIGYDHRFGRNRNADIEDLKKFGELYNFAVQEISAQDINEVAVSSTKIRKALNDGNMTKANSFLGYHFMLTGTVVEGLGLGRQLGYPTANINIVEDYKLIPKQGSYVVCSEINKTVVYGMMNIGMNPTVNGEKETIEVHFFDFDKDIYNKKIQIDLLHRLRDEQKFESVEALKEQLAKDKETALQYLKTIMFNTWLFKQIDNSALIVFRIIFGFLCFLESVGAIFTGWLKRTLIDPDFTFSFIGFEWLQPLPGNGMYYYYAIMGIFGLFVMLGYKYRISIISFTLMWTATYLMQKSSYNNHYYLLILISGIMCFLPANSYTSFDVKRNPKLERFSMPQWCRWIIILQLFIVYTYAATAKLNTDWLNTSVIEILMKAKSDYLLIGDLLQQKWLHYILAYGGILFDGFIIPLLLFKPTRKWAFMVSIVFHLFNSVIFQIGIFPYLSLAFTLFFFEAEIIQKLFLKKKPFYNSEEIEIPNFNKPLMIGFLVYFLFQIGLPLRHHFIDDDVLWTEEGHRLSWRMMLRTKSGHTMFYVENKETGKRMLINLDDYLTPKQKLAVSSKPDFMWQFAQRLKGKFNSHGQDISVYVDSKVSVNGKPFKAFIAPKVDLAAVKWQPFKHHDWILPSKEP